MSNNQTDTFFVTDAPLTEGDSRSDLLERQWFAEQVAARIAQAGAEDSVVFGLAGPWGAGKTSTLTQIKKALPPKWEVVEFTPWATSNEVALTDEFYNTIASALDGKSTKNTKRLKQAQKLIRRTAPLLAVGAQTFASGFIENKFGEGVIQKTLEKSSEKAVDELNFDEDPFAKRFDKISGLLNSVGLQVLVIVDDVDRLHRDELLAVMKAVRLLGRFKGVHYLLSYDTKTVVDVLTHTDLAGGDRRRAQQYLEKIVQYPFQLPPIQDVHLADVIDKCLRETTQRHGYHPDRTERDLEVLLARLPLDEITLRTVYRLFAQVDMMLTLITEKGSPSRPCDEIDLLDAILLTYVRLEHHDLYRHLATWKNGLTFHNGTSIDVDKDKERANALIQKITDAIDPKKKNPSDTQHALVVLRALFPDAVSRLDDAYRPVPDKAPFQIRQLDYFDRYFAFGFPAKDIRDGHLRADLVALIETGNIPPESKLHEYANNRVTSALLRTKLREGLSPALEQATDLSHCGDAARTLTRLTTNQERREPHLRAWWAVVTFQLWQALESAHGTGAAQGAVADYLREYGADMTAVAVDVGGLGPESPLWKAMTPLWDEIHQKFVEALLDTSDHIPEPNPVQQYWFWIEKHPTLYLRVQESIERHIAEQRSIDLISITTRLVGVGTYLGKTEERLSLPSMDTLKVLVPRNKWPVSQLPNTIEAGVDPFDLTYENRRKFAKNALAQYLQSETAEEES